MEQNMARIRTIKPEFFVSAQVADVSPTCRLLFVGMWLFCDDAGIHPASAKQLKMEVFPGDDITIVDVRAMVDELIRVGLIVEYEAEVNSHTQAYWKVTGWHHQKIERPRYQYPEPDSTTRRRHVGDTSMTPRSLTVPETTVPETTVPDATTNVVACGEEASPPTTASEYGFPTTNGGTWYLSLRKLEQYRDTYGGRVNLDGELRKARQWLRDNASRRKTAGGMAAFLTRWLNRATDSSNPRNNSGPMSKDEYRADRDRRLAKTRALLDACDGGAK
jgi:hypothetical protein